MQPLRTWSFARVALTAGAWILVCLFAAVAYVLYQFRGLFVSSSGSGGIGAVSSGLFNLLTLVIPLLPPVALIVAWLIARRSTAG
jgi:hypothetical protein